MKTLQFTAALLSCLFTGAVFAGGGSEFHKEVVINKGCVSLDGSRGDCSSSGNNTSPKKKRPHAPEPRYDENLFNAVCPPSISYQIQTVNLHLSGNLESMSWEKKEDGVECNYAQETTEFFRGEVRNVRARYKNRQLNVEFSLKDGRAYSLVQTAKGGTLTQVEYLGVVRYGYVFDFGYLGPVIAIDALSDESNLTLAPLIPLKQ